MTRVMTVNEMVEYLRQANLTVGDFYENGDLDNGKSMDRLAILYLDHPTILSAKDFDNPFPMYMLVPSGVEVPSDESWWREVFAKLEPANTNS